MPFYAVRKGFCPGIYHTWDECKAQVDHFRGAQFKKFPSLQQAEAFCQGSASQNPTAARPAAAGVASTRPAPCPDPGRARPPADTDSMRRGIDGARRQLDALKDQLHRYRSGELVSPCRGRTDAAAEDATRAAAEDATRAVAEGATSDGAAAADGFDRFVVDEDGFLNVWTDGACSSNGQRGARAGFGVWFNHAHPLNVSAPVDGPATNNNAEIQAAWMALEVAAAAGHRRVLLHTDSQFVISCATRWLEGWKRNGWRLAGGGPVKNRTQLEALSRAMAGVEIKWNYVRGHSGVDGNEGADRLAVAGALRYTAPDP
ncbi:ribonuclease H1-like [Pollicipes pollicipes]|uniref:ribonuclease H1-like n=1 Tax=Pollicipes pollicipes TaxID=41117 RepID=UPI0018854D93|nr:ribonuclease H1-like [Pollicipes pollicipes]